MTRDDIIRMAREVFDVETDSRGRETFSGDNYGVERFASLVAAAEREILADWMRQHGFSTGQAYTTESLLDRLGTEIVENTDVAVLAERWECAKVCDEVGDRDADTHAYDAATAIRARGNT